MTTLLILDGHTPDKTTTIWAAAFVEALRALDPGVALRIEAPYLGALTQDVFDGVDGVIFTGSGVDWSPDAPEAAPLQVAAEQAFATGLPVWGSCNGMQLAAVVLGGSVGPSPNGLEVGVCRDTRLSDAGRTHAMMAGRADTFAVPCVHSFEVKRLPEGAELLAGNDHSPVQAFSYERGGVIFWGAQYHPELTSAALAVDLREAGVTFAGKDQLSDDLAVAETDAAAAHRIGTTPQELALLPRSTELANWLTHVKDRTTT